MCADPSAQLLSLPEARVLLGIGETADRALAVAAFRTAIKAARPDRPEGDGERFRRLIEAYRLVTAVESYPRAAPVVFDGKQHRKSATPVLVLEPDQALRGAVVDLDVQGRRLRVTVPPGMRSGERLRLSRAGSDLSDLHLPVLIRPAEGLSVLGDHLYMTLPVSPRLLEDGGRLEIETHGGVRSVWVIPDQHAPRLRLKDLGLPQRGKRPQGHLFVTLEPASDAPSPAEDMLSQFTRVWTPDRMAA